MADFSTSGSDETGSSFQRRNGGRQAHASVMLVLGLGLGLCLRTEIQYLGLCLDLRVRYLDLLFEYLDLCLCRCASGLAFVLVVVLELATKPSPLRNRYSRFTKLQIKLETVTYEAQLNEFLYKINCEDSNNAMSVKTACDVYRQQQPLFLFVFCTPATPAPVERVFSQSGLIMRPHHSRMSDVLLETSVFLKCNGCTCTQRS